MPYAIAGLQRTGTTYLERVIIDNYGLDGLVGIFWKHALPLEIDQNTLSSTTVILNIRHPITWFQSCVSNRSADILEERSGYFSGRRQVEGYAALYSEFYSRWREHLDKYGGIYAKYEDIVCGNVSVLAPIANRQGRTGNVARTDIAKVPSSIAFSSDDLERHRRLECHMAKNAALEFWDLLDHSLIDDLGYDAENLIFTTDVGLRTLAYRLLRHPWTLSEEDLDLLFSASTEQFADDCQVLHALGHQAAQRCADPRKALDLYQAALLASEREREFYGVYSDLAALNVIEAAKAIAPKFTASLGAETDDLLTSRYEAHYQQLHAATLGIFENVVAAETDGNVTAVARCRNLVHLGDLLQRVDRLDEAQTTLGRAIALDRNCLAAHSLLGDILQRRGRLEEAETCLREAIRIAPEDASLRAKLRDLFWGQGKIESALIEARAAVHSADPDTWWFHAHACLALRAGRLDEALESLWTALRSEPNHRDHLFVLAEVQQRQGRLDEAAASLRHAVRFAPDDAHLHFMLGDVLRRRGRLDEAANSLRQAVRFAPDDGHLHFVLGDTLRCQGRLDEAQSYLRQAIRITPQNGRLHFVLSDVLRRQGRIAEAVVEAAAAIECSEAEPWWFHHHARLASRNGDLDHAEISLRRALKFEPDNPRHLLALAKVLLLTGRPREAQNAVRRAIRFDLRRRFVWVQSRLRPVFNCGTIIKPRDPSPHS